MSLDDSLLETEIVVIDKGGKEICYPIKIDPVYEWVLWDLEELRKKCSIMGYTLHVEFRPSEVIRRNQAILAGLNMYN
ncbi:MAG: hypothetical protein AABW46_01465 [Nanoarchaeota archaeon]